MYEQTIQERAKNLTEKVLERLDSQHRLMLMPFLPSFHRLLENATDEQILNFISEIRNIADYVEFGNAEQN